MDIKKLNQTVLSPFANRNLLAVLVLIMIICGMAITLKLFSEKELLYETLAAIIGVILTAIITLVLLNGQLKAQKDLQNEQCEAQANLQSKQNEAQAELQAKLLIQQEESQKKLQTEQNEAQQKLQVELLKQQKDADVAREKEQKIYEEKLQIYQKFLASLCEALKDGQISKEEKTQLIFETASIAMHTSVGRIMAISESINELIQQMNRPDPGTEPESHMLKSLFRIVGSFREELYASASNAASNQFAHELHEQAETTKSIMKNFAEAFNSIETEQTAPEPCVVRQESAGELLQVSEKSEKWLQKIREWEADGWVTETIPHEDCFRLKKEGYPGWMQVSGNKDHPFVMAVYEGTDVFARAMKWEYKGRRSYGSWWKYFDGEFYHVAQGQLLRLLEWNGRLQEYVVDWFSKIMEHLRVQHETRLWLAAVKEKWAALHPDDHDICDLGTWYWRVLYCNFKKEDEVVPFLDIFREGDKVAIHLYNRCNNEEKLKLTLARIEINETPFPRAENGRVVLAEIDSATGAEDAENIAAKITCWMQKIAG